MGELPVYTCQAHVFSINPKTKKSWIPSSSKAVDVNFFYDSNKQCYRIISIEDGPTGKKVIINSILTEKMVFKKTSQKFGQWADSKTGGVHGLGFNSESELTDFVNHFKHYADVSKGLVCATAGSNGRLSSESFQSAVNCSNLPLLQKSSAPLHGSITHTPLDGTLAPTLTSSTGDQPDTLTHQVYLPHSSSLHLQQQLKQAQAHVRRLEDELSATQRHAISSGLPLTSGGGGVPGFPISELGSPLNDTTGHSSDRLGVSGAEDIAPELRDRLSRLDMGEPPLNNGTEDDWSADGSASTLHAPTVKQSPLSIAQPNGPSGRGIWMDRSTSETVHSLYTRLGYLLRETVELHARLGALLPHTTPSTSFE